MLKFVFHRMLQNKHFEISSFLTFFLCVKKYNFYYIGIIIFISL